MNQANELHVNVSVGNTIVASVVSGHACEALTAGYPIIDLVYRKFKTPAAAEAWANIQVAAWEKEAKTSARVRRWRDGEEIK